MAKPKKIYIFKKKKYTNKKTQQSIAKKFKEQRNTKPKNT